MQRTMAPAAKASSVAPRRRGPGADHLIPGYAPPSGRPTSKKADPQLAATYQSWARLLQENRRFRRGLFVPRGLETLVCESTLRDDDPSIIDPAWVKSFDTFVSDMGIRPAETVLARRDLFQPFIPSNCYWRRRRRPGRVGADVTVYIEHDGRKQPVDIWAEELGISEEEVLETFRHDGQAGATALESSTSANA